MIAATMPPWTRIVTSDGLYVEGDEAAGWHVVELATDRTLASYYPPSVTDAHEALLRWRRQHEQLKRERDE